MDPSSSTESTPIRQEFVENARKFLTNDKVRSTPLAEQKKFLLAKGVTQEEIDAALAQIPENQVSLLSVWLPFQVKRSELEVSAVTDLLGR